MNQKWVPKGMGSGESDPRERLFRVPQADSTWLRGFLEAGLTLPTLTPPTPAVRRKGAPSCPEQCGAQSPLQQVQRGLCKGSTVRMPVPQPPNMTPEPSQRQVLVELLEGFKRRVIIYF